MWSSQTRDWTCVPYIGRQILNHWTTREVQDSHCLATVMVFQIYIYIYTHRHTHIYMYMCQVTSVVSNSLRPPWTVACHTPPYMEILQARILEWVACPSSRGPSPPRDQTPVSYVSCIGRQVLYPLVPPGKPFMYIYVKTLHQNGHLKYMCYLLCINHPSKTL